MTKHKETTNSKVRWSNKEAELLSLMYTNGIGIDKIADHFNRTEQAIYGKLWRSGLVGSANAPDTEEDATPTSSPQQELPIEKEPIVVTKTEAIEVPVEVPVESVSKPQLSLLSMVAVATVTSAVVAVLVSTTI